MPRTRNSHPAGLKAKVAVEAIKAHKTAAQIAQMFVAHTAWDYWIGLADRMCRCREPLARTRNCSHEGNRHSHCDRRLAYRTGPAASHRRLLLAVAGGLAGNRSRLLGRDVPAGYSDPVRFPALPEHRDGHAAARVQPGCLAGRRAPLLDWFRHCVPHGAISHRASKLATAVRRGLRSCGGW